MEHESPAAAVAAWVLGCLAVYGALFATGALLYGRMIQAAGLGAVAVGAAWGVMRLLPRVGVR